MRHQQRNEKYQKIIFFYPSWLLESVMFGMKSAKEEIDYQFVLVELKYRLPRAFRNRILSHRF